MLLTQEERDRIFSTIEAAKLNRPRGYPRYYISIEPGGVKIGYKLINGTGTSNFLPWDEVTLNSIVGVIRYQSYLVNVPNGVPFTFEELGSRTL